MQKDFRRMYRQNDARWDTGITPPEIKDLIEAGHLQPHRAVDLGCGTGTNAIYLAQRGWHVTGIDFVRKPIRQARRKARKAGLKERTEFVVGDVRNVRDIVEEPCRLAVDIGCGHVLGRKEFVKYAKAVSQVLTPNGTWMLYAHHPREERPGGLDPEFLMKAVAPHFRVVWHRTGEDTTSGGGSSWMRLQRREG